jgi:hypothetical protein
MIANCLNKILLAHEENYKPCLDALGIRFMPLMCNLYAGHFLWTVCSPNPMPGEQQIFVPASGSIEN